MSKQVNRPQASRRLDTFRSRVVTAIVSGLAFVGIATAIGTRAASGSEPGGATEPATGTVPGLPAQPDAPGQWQVIPVPNDGSFGAIPGGIGGAFPPDTGTQGS